MEIIALSIGRKILEVGSRDYTRTALYARYLDGLHVIVLTRWEHGFTHDVHESALHLYPTNSSSRVHMLIDAFRIARRILRERKGEVTLTAQDPLELGALARILSMLTMVPYTVQVHGDYYSPHWPGRSFIQRLRRFLIPFSFGKASTIRVVSLRVARSLRARGVPPERLFTLPIRPELESFLGAARTRSKEDHFTVLTASRLSPEKNIPLLVRAFALLHTRHPDARLRIVGEGSERARIEATIASLALTDSVILLPWTERIELEMANADVFALASLHESYGLVLLESLATGVPVVTTDVGCAGEIVKDGEHGLVVPVGDERAFADALIRMYEDTNFRTRMGILCRTVGGACGHYSEDEYAKEWVAAHSVA